MIGHATTTAVATETVQLDGWPTVRSLLPVEMSVEGPRIHLGTITICVYM